MSRRSVNRNSVYKNNLVNTLLSRRKFTPDFSVLRFYKQIPLFVYCSLKRGGEHSELLQGDGALFYGMAHTSSPGWVMKENGHFPFMVRAESSVPGIRARVRGELWGCSVEHICRIDTIFGNGIHLKRRIVKITLEDQEDNPEISALAYCVIDHNFLKTGRYSNVLTIGYPNSVNPVVRDKRFFDWNQKNYLYGKGTFDLLDGWPDETETAIVNKTMVEYGD